MTAPTNTYNADVNLNLGQVPRVDDPALYDALLDIHNALEHLVTHTEGRDDGFQDYIDKQRKVIAVSDNYLVLVTDGTILVDGSTAVADITITLPPVADITGYLFRVKRIDPAPVSFKVILKGTGSELIDGHALGVTVSSLSSYTVKATDTGWVIV